MVVGHENMGVVEEVGPAVNRVKVGDLVSVPFNLSCGTCRNCNDGFTSACLRANPSGNPGVGYGHPKMGPHWGGQAELLHVPWADFNLFKLPEGKGHDPSGPEHPELVLDRLVKVVRATGHVGAVGVDVAEDPRRSTFTSP